jgi:hypothetical protein
VQCSLQCSMQCLRDQAQFAVARDLKDQSSAIEEEPRRRYPPALACEQVYRFVLSIRRTFSHRNIIAYATRKPPELSANR